MFTRRFSGSGKLLLVMGLLLVVAVGASLSAEEKGGSLFTVQAVQGTEGLIFIAEGASVENVALTIYDLAGRPLFTGEEQGSQVLWPLTTAGGERVANGVYLYVLTVTGADGATERHFGKAVVLDGQVSAEESGQSAQREEDLTTDTTTRKGFPGTPADIDGQVRPKMWGGTYDATPGDGFYDVNGHLSVNQPVTARVSFRETNTPQQWYYWLRGGGWYTANPEMGLWDDTASTSVNAIVKRGSSYDHYMPIVGRLAVNLNPATTPNETLDVRGHAHFRGPGSWTRLEMLGAEEWELNSVSNSEFRIENDTQGYIPFSIMGGATGPGLNGGKVTIGGTFGSRVDAANTFAMLGTTPTGGAPIGFDVQSLNTGDFFRFSLRSRTWGNEFLMTTWDSSAATWREFLVGNISTGAVRLGSPGSPVAVTINGSLNVTGAKLFIEDDPRDSGKVIAYAALEGPESGTYLRGTAELVNGEALIELPEHFSLVTAEEGLTVHLTPLGEWLQLYIEEKTTTRIVVREASGKDGRFDYLVQGVRKGYEDFEVIRSKSQ